MSYHFIPQFISRWRNAQGRLGSLLPYVLMICLGLPRLAFATDQPPDELTLAVAANFSKPIEVLIARYKQGHQINIHVSLGSTTQLATQLRQGAPVDVLMSADQSTPSMLCHEAVVLCESSLTYAVGHLVLWSDDADVVDAEGQVLFKHLTRLSIANPELAPYGRAALETLQHLHLVERTQASWVIGENITQAYQFVLSHNAPVGFVAASQVYEHNTLKHGSAWRVPDNYHAPLIQVAAISSHAPHPTAARAWLAWLHAPEALMIIRDFGYDVP